MIIDKMERSEMHYAANTGDLNKVRDLISEGMDVNLKDKNGMTSLHFAAQSQSSKVVSLLIESGAEVDARDIHGNSPLSNAVFNYSNDGSTIELLRAHGANPYSKNNYGQTPLGLARLIANKDVSKYFKDLP